MIPRWALLWTMAHFMIISVASDIVQAFTPHYRRLSSRRNSCRKFNARRWWHQAISLFSLRPSIIIMYYHASLIFHAETPKSFSQLLKLCWISIKSIATSIFSILIAFYSPLIYLIYTPRASGKDFMIATISAPLLRFSCLATLRLRASTDKIAD